jgi:membrane dipeptidase
MKKTILFILLTFVFTEAGAQTMPADADPKIWARALEIHKSAIIIDGHNDITSPMVDMDFNLAEDSTGRFHSGDTPFHTDLRRMKASGMTGQFMSIYVSGRGSGMMRRAMDMIDATYREAERHKDLTMCTTAAEIRIAKKDGKICLLMGIEGGYAIENSLHALRNFYRLGIRYMTLTHNVTHDWADAHADEKRHNGLTDFGKEVVREMNRLGILVDISHVSDKVMHDALDITTAPVIASHSGARGVSNHTRNVPDDVLKRLPANGGVIMVVFYPVFLDERSAKEVAERNERLRDQVAALREKHKDNDEAFYSARRALYDANPVYLADYRRIVDHIDHIKKVAGIEHAGLGSDYDGVPFLNPPMRGMEDLVLVTYEMLRRGYSEKEIRMVLGENMLRAMEQAERVASGNRISADGSLMKINK